MIKKSYSKFNYKNEIHFKNFVSSFMIIYHLIWATHFGEAVEVTMIMEINILLFLWNLKPLNLILIK